LPITGTGYRSLFVSTLRVQEAGGPVSLVERWLDTEAGSAAWKSGEERKRQLSLF
jgi:hypothetical protein